MRARFAAVVVGCAALLTACTDDSPADSAAASVPTPKSAVTHANFRDCGEFRQYYARSLARKFDALWRPCWGCEPLGDGNDVIFLPIPSVSHVAAPELGVDEADIIEADADTRRLYLLRRSDRSELVTVNAEPAEALAVASRTEIGAGPQFGTGLFLDAAADRLVAVNRRHAAFGGSTQLLFYDVTDPDLPQLADRYEIRGDLLGTRRVGQRLHVVTVALGDLPRSLRDDPSFQNLVYERYYRAVRDGQGVMALLLAAQIRARIEQAVQGAPLAELLPVWRQGLTDEAPVHVDCSLFSRPQVGQRPDFVVISSIDTDGGGLTQIGAMNEGWRMYASAEHVYLTQSSRSWWWDRAQRQQTALYRFRLDAEGPAQRAGLAMVDGFLRGESYALSEHEGHLRLVTFEGVRDEDWRRTNHLFVLGPTDAEPFEIVGQLRDLAGAAFTVTRFFGDRGVAAIDDVLAPVSVFDLSDPAQPRLAGSFQLSSQLNYLRPLGENQLLAYGRTISSSGGMLSQVGLQEFDIADADSPQLLASVLFGEPGQWTWSVTPYEPRALTLLGDVLSVPLQVGSPDADAAFSGFVAYRVAEPGGFTELGRTDHKEVDGSGDGCPSPNGSIAPCQTFAPVRFNTPLRSVLLDEPGGRTVLYTLSDAFLKADVVADSLTPIQTLPLAPAE